MRNYEEITNNFISFKTS